MRFNLRATCTLICVSNFSGLDSDFVDPDCLKLVSSVQYLSPPVSWPLYQLSKSLSFIHKTSEMFAHFTVNSATRSLEQQQVCWSVCLKNVNCLKPVVSVFFSLRSVSTITAIFIASLLLEFSNQGLSTYLCNYYNNTLLMSKGHILNCCLKREKLWYLTLWEVIL